MPGAGGGDHVEGVQPGHVGLQGDHVRAAGVGFPHAVELGLAEIVELAVDGGADQVAHYASRSSVAGKGASATSGSLASPLAIRCSA